jgi:hypothetical protein
MIKISSHLSALIDVVNKPEEPSVPVGRHCRSPFECDYTDYCWQLVPEYSVFNVFGGAKLDGLLAANIVDLIDLPAGFPLTDRQRIDINAYECQSIHVDSSGIDDFLNKLEYPLHYLDYETIFPAIPLFDNSSPYQQIPFQFSLHIQNKRGGELKHIEFLHTDMSDPRSHFASSLIEHCGTEGSVVVYNMSFESRINRELSVTFPRLATKLERINSRMVDLLVPFRSRNLYHPRMKGSASIKSVLPAFVPELTYDNLSISDGDMASINYLKCLKNMALDDDKSEIYNNLRRYCEMDTYAEVLLVEKLYEMSGN